MDGWGPHNGWSLRKDAWPGRAIAISALCREAFLKGQGRKFPINAPAASIGGDCLEGVPFGKLSLRPIGPWHTVCLAGSGDLTRAVPIWRMPLASDAFQGREGLAKTRIRQETGAFIRRWGQKQSS